MPLEGLKPSCEIVSINEFGEVLFELGMIVVMEALDRRLLDRAVHSFDLPIGPPVTATSLKPVTTAFSSKTVPCRKPG